MILSKFKLFDRGFKETLLLIPGWATDHRIFGYLDLTFNYLVPTKFSPVNFKKELITALHDNGIEKVYILGWSMGAFLASDFVSEYQDYVGDVIFMVSIRERYEKDAIEEIKVHLKKNRKGYLYKFYSECFCESEKEIFLRLKNSLLKKYITDMKIKLLYEGLDYLEDAHMGPKNFEKLNVIFIHGREDKIAPIQEALKIKESLPQAEFIALDRTGHMPFFNPSFSNLVRSSLLPKCHCERTK